MNPHTFGGARSQAKARQELDDEQRKRDTDDALKLDMASDRRRADDYAIRNRVRRQAAPGPTSNPDLPETGPAAQGDNGPGDVAELVGITRADFDICTVNSRRLANVHDWALTADRVIPEVAFGGE